MVPIFFVVEVLRRRHSADSLLDAVKETFKPTSDWCPKDALLRRQYHDFISTKKPELQGIDNPLPPVASSGSLSTMATSDSKANITQYNTSV